MVSNKKKLEIEAKSMNQEELQKNIALYYNKLPKNLQDFFADMNWLNTLQEINTKYNLSPEQVETLSTETTLALLDIVPMEDYVKILEQELKIPDDKKDEFFSELNEKIFKDIGYELEDTFIKNTNELAEEKYNGEKKLDERFAGLPKEVQDAIARSGWREKLYKISQDHKLNIEQMGIVEDITTKMITGNIHSDQYESALNEKLGTTSEEVGKIVNEVNENILKSIREGEKIITNDQLLINNEKANTENKPTNPLEEKLIRPVSSTTGTIQNNPKTTGSDPYREII